jgi:hypothetical protein
MSDPFTQAMELLLGDRPGREEIEEAGRLFERASAEGNSEASERCAMFDAFGMARPQSWTRALDMLALAASQGSRSAQDQLLLLNDNEVDPGPVERTDWIALRTGIDIDARMQPGEKLALSEVPRVRTIKRFATGPECRFLISLASERLVPATVFSDADGEQTHHQARDNSYLVMRIGEMNVLTEVIRHRISAATKLPVPLFEPSQLLHYAVGERFKPHHDFLDPANEAYRNTLSRFGQRIATFLIYLNDAYSGGETSFPAIGLNFRAETGDALFFANVTREGAPDPSTLHAGRAPLSGEKWVFSQWIRDRFPAA